MTMYYFLAWWTKTKTYGSFIFSFFLFSSFLFSVFEMGLVVKLGHISLIIDGMKRTQNLVFTIHIIHVMFSLVGSKL